MFTSSRQPRSLKLWWTSRWTLRRWWVKWKIQRTVDLADDMRKNPLHAEQCGLVSADINTFFPSPFSGTQTRIMGSAARPISTSTPTWVTSYKGALHEIHWITKTYLHRRVWIKKKSLSEYDFSCKCNLIISAQKKFFERKLNEYKVVQVIMLLCVCEILSCIFRQKKRYNL